jgi:hypothetical protein
VNEKHPLYETPVYMTLPFMRPFACFWKCCPKKKKYTNIEHATVNTVQSKDMQEDPFMRFGFGIYGYFDFITMMIIAYSLCTLLVLPQLIIYSKSEGI